MKHQTITITKEAAEALGVTNLMVIKKEVEFLAESNAIEGVFDEDSLMQACYAWQYLKTQKKLTHSVILKVHKILMLHHLVGINKGYYRIADVGIYKGNILIRKCLDPKLIQENMELWITNANLFPEHWQNHHVTYERIHPFIDGNGRTGRMFMNWQRLKAHLPILIIKNDEKQEYYQWFS